MSGGASAQRGPKLLVVLPSATIGGAETTAYDLLRGLRPLDCALLTQEAIADHYRELGIPIHCFDDGGGTEPCSLSRANIRLYGRIIQAVAVREGADVILAMMHHGTVFAGVANRLFGLELPVIGTILGNVSAYFAAVGTRASPLEHGVVRYCLSRSRALVTPSYGVREDLIAHYGGNADRIKVIFNGIDGDRCRALASAPLDVEFDDGPWVVSASRLCAQKDYPTLLKAFRLVLDRTAARLILVGDGDQREHIVRLANQLNITDRIVMVGYKPNPFPYMRRADVFVLSSFFEGFGNVIVEAMALGCPVVASDCPSGPAEIIRDGVNGLLVPVGNAEAMAEALLRLLGDRSYSRRVSEAGCERAKVFNMQRMVADFKSLILAVTGIANTQPRIDV